MAAIPQTSERILLENISWPTYLSLLEDLGAHRGRLTYHRGRLEIVTLSKPHEHWKRLVGRLIETFTEERRIPIQSVSSTTLNREDLQSGVEADECYYVANEAAVRNREKLDLTRDPPPDLVVEIEFTRRIVPRVPIYAAMGVPEIWCYDGSRLRVVRLSEHGSYEPASESGVFPELSRADVDRFLARRTELGETELVREFRSWVRDRFGTRSELG